MLRKNSDIIKGSFVLPLLENGIRITKCLTFFRVYEIIEHIKKERNRYEYDSYT